MFIIYSTPLFTTPLFHSHIYYYTLLSTDYTDLSKNFISSIIMGALLDFAKCFGFHTNSSSSKKRIVAVDRDQKCSFTVTTRFSWEQIERFTNNFSLVIGYGGFSTVYLAEKLSVPGCVIAAAAVKVQSCCSERLNRAYKQELQILMNLRHPNIVKLIGHCDDHEEGVLIFEYAPNGNLEEKLHGSKKVLSWKRRMAIAFQLAQALDYLHQQQIVHGDIKSSNILLDENLDCKLCDFGSAKMGFSSAILPPSNSDSPFARRNNRIMMMGSPGYTDPHYLRTGLATKNNDVYSFGIVLLELITGIEAFNPSGGERLITKAEPMLRNVEKVVEMVDPCLPGHDVHVEEARAMAAIAAMCLCDSPSLRPCAGDVLSTMREKVTSISFLLEKEIR